MAEPGQEDDGTPPEAPGGRVIHCPHCGAPLKKDDISVIIFPSATIFACPRCKKSIALDPANF